MTSIFAKATKKINKHGAPYTYYMHKDRANPVFEQFDHDCNDFVAFIDQLKSGQKVNSTRPSTWLFDIWKRFETRLPPLYFNQRVIDIGDFLLSSNQQKLAMNLCFDKYLVSLSGGCNYDSLEKTQFQGLFFPDGFESDDSQLTIRALMGRVACKADLVFGEDPRFQNPDSLDRSLECLKFIQLVMEVALPYESMFWLVFNGTVHIYTIARRLMRHGYSEKMVEYLIWSALAMEHSIPLLEVQYLSWRSTLYATVCEAYADCGYGNEVQNFGKRALRKINELRQAENISSSEYSPDVEIVFREACVKIAVILFKQTVLATKQRNRNIFRPKQRADLTTVKLQAWPRTTTEKLLSEMFEGSSAQFLCILESLTEPSRRLLHSSPPGHENEVEVLDLYDELFMAAQDIISGGGGNPAPVQQSKQSLTKLSSTQIRDGSNLKAVCLDQTLIEMGSEGLSSITLTGVIRLVKLAYNWENWDVFETLIVPTLSYIDDLDEASKLQYMVSRKELQLLVLMSKMNRSFRQRQQQLEKLAAQAQTTDGSSPVEKPQPQSGLEKLLTVCEFLLSLMDDTEMVEKFDVDLIIDSALYVWKKCKSKFTSEHFHDGKFSSNESSAKWVYLLDSVNKVLHWCDFYLIDPVLMGELAMRLATILEQNCSRAQSFDLNEKYFLEETVNVSPSLVGSQHSLALGAERFALPRKPPEEQLFHSKVVLDQCLSGIARVRQQTAKSDGSAIADLTLEQDLNEELFNPNQTDLTVTDDDVPSVDLLCDLHVELMNTYYRICLKLHEVVLEKARIKKRDIPSTSLKELFVGKQPIDNIEQLAAKSKSNELLKALFIAQKALFSLERQKKNSDYSKMLTESKNALKAYQVEQRKLYHQFSQLDAAETRTSSIPPPPDLLSITNGGVILRPVPFTVPDNLKISYYRVFGKRMVDKNSKVRLSDYKYEGTGEYVQATNALFSVTGLEVGQRYSFAVAAFNTDGDIIGGSIGHQTGPILIFPPLSVAMAWSFVCQTAYQCDVADVTAESFDVLWNHFIAKDPDPVSETFIDSKEEIAPLAQFQLNRKILERSSPILIRQFVLSTFARVQLSIKENGLFCDQLCDNGPARQQQLCRLRECERVIVALELAGWLNDMSLVLQCLVILYGLIAPLIFYRIKFATLLQILKRVFGILLELPVSIREQAQLMENMNHLTAVVVYSLVRMLRETGDRQLATDVMAMGVKLLSGKFSNIHSALQLASASSEEPGDAFGDENVNVSAHAKSKQKNVKTKPDTLKDTFVDVESPKDTTNPELKALEVHLGRYTKPSGPDFELSGHEDPSLLYAYIAYLPSRTSYKEVVKFRRRPRFLELFVQVLQKAVGEDLCEIALEWIDENLEYIARRNESISGIKSKFVRYMSLPASPDKQKTYKAQVAEFTKDDRLTPKPPPEKDSEQKDKKKTKKAPSFNRKAKLRSYDHLPDHLREKAEANDLAALDKLAEHLPPFYAQVQRRRKFRSLYFSELPWMSQLQLLAGIGHYRVFMQRLRFRDRILGEDSRRTITISCLCPDVVFFDGGGALMDIPALSKQLDALDLTSTRREARFDEFVATGELKKDTEKSTIEVIAMATADVATIPLTPVVDTPRTYRSEVGNKKDKDKDQEKLSVERRKLLSEDIFMTELRWTFDSLRRAIILADRGHLVVHLVNCCHVLWNIFNDLAMILLCADRFNQFVVSYEQLREITIPVFCLAADCLLDLMLALSKGVTLCYPNFTEAKQNKGALSLHFDSIDSQFPLNQSFVKKFMLRTLDLLFFESKWEKLVHYSLKFNACTHDRFMSLVGPMMVYAQRQLVRRIKDNFGEVPPQKYHKEFMMRMGSNQITATDYVSFEPRIAKEGSKEVETPENADEELSPLDSKALVFVPIDTARDLRTLKLIQNKEKNCAQLVQHCRKLLTSFLVTQASGKSEELAGALPGVTPVTLVSEDIYRSSVFANRKDVESSPFAEPRFVVRAYEKAIDSVLSTKEIDIVAQLYRELGLFYLAFGDQVYAKKFFSKSISALVGIDNYLKLVSDDFPWKKCGLWGCLMCGINASTIAQFLAGTSEKIKLRHLLFARKCFMNVLGASLPHPFEESEFASYEIKELLPGVDLFSDKWRLDERTLLDSLQFCTEALFSTGYHFEMLPILSLMHYVAANICRNVGTTVRCKILRVQALSKLNMFKEAFSCLVELFHGEKLPQDCFTAPRTADSRSPNVAFDNSKPFLDEENLRALDYLLVKKLSFDLANLYGPVNTILLSCCHAELLTSLAECITQLPNMSIYGSGEGLIQAQRTFTRNKRRKMSIVSSTSSQQPATALSPGKADRSKRRKSSVVVATAPQLKEEKSVLLREGLVVSPAFLRNVLLSSAESKMVKILEPILGSDEMNEINLFELQVAVRSQLLLAEISLQREHGRIAAYTVLQLMKFLQKSKLLSTAADEPIMADRPPTVAGFELENFKTQNLFNLFHWLQCHLTLVKGLVMEIKMVADSSKFPDDARIVEELATSRHYCEHGIEKAHRCSAYQLEAEFIWQQVQLNVIEGKSLESCLELLESLLDRLAKFPMSRSGELLHTSAMILLSDLKSPTTEMYQSMFDALVTAVARYGQSFERFYRNDGLKTLPRIADPMANIYLKEAPLFVHLMVRIARHLMETGSGGELVSLRLLEDSEKLFALSMRKHVGFDSQIKFLKGQCLKTLYRLDNERALEDTLQPFMEAVELNCQSVYDSAFVQSCFIELADALISEVPNYEDEETKDAASRRCMEFLVCAAVAGNGRRARRQMTGSDEVTSNSSLADDNVTNMPEFVAVDVTGDHVVGEAKRVYANEIEEEMAPLVESMKEEERVTYAQQIDKCKLLTKDLGWLPVLSYEAILNRICREMPSSTTRSTEVGKIDGSIFLYPVCSQDWCVRLSYLRNYLLTNLPLYHNECQLVKSSGVTQGDALLEFVNPVEDLPFKQAVAVQWKRERGDLYLLFAFKKDKKCRVGRKLISDEKLDSFYNMLLGFARQNVDVSPKSSVSKGKKRSTANLAETKRLSEEIAGLFDLELTDVSSKTFSYSEENLVKLQRLFEWRFGSLIEDDSELAPFLVNILEQF